MIFFSLLLKTLSRSARQYLLYPRIIGLWIAVTLTSGYLITLFERGHSPDFHTWWDGIWFAVITASTVGYGDKVPVTLGGQLVTIGLIIVGGSLLAVLIANIGGTLALRVNRRERGMLSATHHRGHIVMCNWNKQTRSALDDFRQAHPNIRIVLVDDHLDANPAEEDVHFIRGNCAEDAVLMKARIDRARTLLIFGDRRLDEHTADARAMKAVLAAKHLNPGVHVIVECLSGDVRSLERVGADEVINTAEINSRLLVHSALSQGVSKSLQELLTHEGGNYFFECPVPQRLIGRTFAEAAAEFRGQNLILVALGGVDPRVNPAPDVPVRKDQVLVYIGSAPYRPRRSSSPDPATP